RGLVNSNCTTFARESWHCIAHSVDCSIQLSIYHMHHAAPSVGWSGEVKVDLPQCLSRS
ncbi:hypothetical protein C0J52_07562, partial [Blattella germanica]